MQLTRHLHLPAFDWYTRSLYFNAGHKVEVEGIVGLSIFSCRFCNGLKDVGKELLCILLLPSNNVSLKLEVLLIHLGRVHVALFLTDVLINLQ